MVQRSQQHICVGQMAKPGAVPAWGKYTTVLKRYSQRGTGKCYMLTVQYLGGRDNRILNLRLA